MPRNAPRFFVSAIVFSSLVGCTFTEVSGSDATPTADTRVGKQVPLPTGKVELPPGTLTSAGKMVVCTSANHPPFEFKTDSGNVVGYDIDLAKAIAAALSITTEFKEAPYTELTTGTALEKGSCDAVIAAVTVTTARMDSMLFSEPYFAAHQALVVPVEKAMEGLSDLKGRKLGVQINTTGELFAKKQYPGAEIVPFQSLSQLVHAVKEGKVDVFINDLGPAANAAFTDPAIVVHKQLDTGEKYAVAVATQNTALKTAIDQALDASKTAGTMKAINAKWFGEGTIAGS